MALVNTIGSQVAAGSTLQNAVVRLAQFRANTPQDTTGLCECSGGNGHCTGCAAIPVYQTKVRVPGEEGAEGRRGDVPAHPLFPGLDGQPGEATIIVTSKTGQPRSYRSRFQLELVDFDVEDENEDGVFEPGEHLFIRRIRIKNTGQSPVTRKLSSNHPDYILQEECPPLQKRRYWKSILLSVFSQLIPMRVGLSYPQCFQARLSLFPDR